MTATCTPSASLSRQVTAGCDENAYKCYQCKKCTSGCPVARYSDMHPAMIMRAVQLGQFDMIFDDRFIWLCTGCETCTTRCPNKVDLTSIMDALRKLSWDAEGASKESYVQLANKLFLQNIRTYGRQYEMRLAAVFNVKSGQFLKDLMLGPKLIAKGKLKMFHSKNKNLSEIEKIFSRIEAMRKNGEAL